MFTCLTLRLCCDLLSPTTLLACPSRECPLCRRLRVGVSMSPLVELQQACLILYDIYVFEYSIGAS